MPSTTTTLREQVKRIDGLYQMVSDLADVVTILNDEICSLKQPEVSSESNSTTSPEPIISEIPKPDYSRLPDITNGRVFYHYNGERPPRPKTTYGLVLDLGFSAARWNLNFDKPVSWVRELPDTLNLDVGEEAVLNKALKDYDSITLDFSQRLLISHAKRNINAGQPNYQLVPDFNLFAVMVADRDPTILPWVWLYYGDKTFKITPDDWTQKPNANYQGKAWLGKPIQGINQKPI